MKMWKNGAFALCSALVLGGSVLALASCNAGGAEKEKEIALGSSVLGNWGYRNADGGKLTKNGEKVEVYVDAETKFHFTITKYYENFAPSVFTFEGQITAIESGVGSCFAVFPNAYLNHGAESEATTTAAKAQYQTYRAGIADIYEGEGQFQITFHRLRDDVMDNGYITVDNAQMDITFGVFTAVDSLAA